jgi:nucleotide-binding universal stress UspA family protein
MKTVLAPIDFSSVSERVIERAIALARATGARLVLLHVVAPWPIIGKNLALTITGAELAAAAEKCAGKKLAELQRSLRDNGVTAHAVHVSGDPRVCIIEQAERLTADYIVIGSHGHTAFYDLLVGSTANGVLKRASCPVIIVPHGAKEASYAETSIAAVGV